MRTYNVLILAIALLTVACNKDFLNKNPLNASSDANFWSSEKNAELWINHAYKALPGATDFYFDPMSDDSFINGTTENGNTGKVAYGTFEPTDNIVAMKWGYTYIRHCLELLERVEQIPQISEEGKNKLKGQARFIIALSYFQKITLYRDVPLVTRTLTVEESDLSKTDKNIVLDYILDQLDLAIEELPLTWPTGQIGRITKGAALALKARVLLYNERWAEAEQAAQEVMELRNNGQKVYDLHANYNELFLTSFNNSTKEVILAHQYALNQYTHTLRWNLAFSSLAGSGSSMPLPDLVNAYETKDGLPISESPLYNPSAPFENRDPRFYHNFIYPGQTFGGVKYDPMNNATDRAQAKTYIYFRKYINDIAVSQSQPCLVNWIIFRYADVLLMYAEAKNENSGPDNAVYDVIDLIRGRAGMPSVDRGRYNTKEKLRDFIRNERRVELAGEGLRYFDILRWKIAEQVMNKEIVSFQIPGQLPLQTIGTRVFDPARHYVWPIPQSAIDKTQNLEQHLEWR